jgi:putative phage-type endonuclease
MQTKATSQPPTTPAPVATSIPKTRMTIEEWRESRKRGIGSSDCAAVLGLDNYRTPLDVYLDKIGEAPDQEENLKMRFGLEAEPIVARMFEQKTGLTVRNDFKIRIHPVYPFLIANLDRTVISNNGRGVGILEIKTTSEAYQKTWEDEVPIGYYLQIQHQMMVTGYEYGYFAILFFGFTGVKDFQIVEVKRDNSFISTTLLPQLIDFWMMNVQTRVPPDPVNTKDLKVLYPRTSTGEEVEARAELLETIGRLKVVKETLKPLEDEKEKLEEQVRLAFLDAEILTYQGAPIATYKQSKDYLKFNQKQFEVENPELAQRYYSIVPGSRRLLVK